MAVSCELLLDTDVIRATVDLVEQSPRAVEALVNRSIRNDVTNRLISRLSVTPGQVHYPIQWKSERQRRAFFATDGFGRGIPTKRTGTVQEGWAMKWDITGRTGTAVIFNMVSYAQFVYAPFQQPFHHNTGWPGPSEIDTIILEESDRANNMLIDGWFSIAEFGGVLA
jgi:hypothetical protein